MFRLAKYDASKATQAHYYLERDPGDGITRMHVIRRQASNHHVCRLQPARPSEGERFYLRAILQHRAVMSFEDAYTVDGTRYETFQDAANALGLFADDDEGELALLEAITTLRTPKQLRVLFVHLLVNECITLPRALWETHQVALSRDLILLHHNGVEELGIQDALEDLGRMLEEYGKSLSHYGLPEPTVHTAEVQHELQRWHPLRQSMREQADAAMAQLNHEQRAIADVILDAVLNERPLCAFVDGQAGRGKTFLVNTLVNYLRARGKIVLPTATSAYAAQLYPGGRTTHSTFKVCYSTLIMPVICMY